METIEINKYNALTNAPGKFESEQPLTPYLWERSMDGDGEILTCHEYDNHFAVKFDLYCHEWEQFANGDNDFPFIWILVENDQGFVTTMTESEYNLFNS